MMSVGVKTKTALTPLQKPARLASVLGPLSIILVSSVFLAGCGDSSGQHTEYSASQTDFDFRIPSSVPAPFVPEDNPMSAEKVELGRHLFFDTRLSGNQTQSCASCHEQELGFADGVALPSG